MKNLVQFFDLLALSRYLITSIFLCFFPSFLTAAHPVSHLWMQSFNQHLQMTYYMSGALLGSGITAQWERHLGLLTTYGMLGAALRAGT